MTPDYDLKSTVRAIPDYPKPGIIFRDLTTLVGDARAFRRAVDELVQPWAGSKIDKIAGIEARGFILGGALAHQVQKRFCLDVNHVHFCQRDRTQAIRAFGKRRGQAQQRAG